MKTGKFKCGIWDWDRNTHVVQNSTVCGNCSRQWEAFGWVRIIRCDTAAHAASPFPVAAVWTADCRLQTQTCFWTGDQETRNRTHASYRRHCKPGPSPAPSPECNGAVCPACNQTRCPCPPTKQETNIGGNWYSTHAKQCVGEARPGDGDGCAWRVVGEPLIRNATCVMGKLASAAMAAVRSSQPTSAARTGGAARIITASHPWANLVSAPA